MPKGCRAERYLILVILSNHYYYRGFIDFRVEKTIYIVFFFFETQFYIFSRLHIACMIHTCSSGGPHSRVLRENRPDIFQLFLDIFRPFLPGRVH